MGVAMAAGGLAGQAEWLQAGWRLCPDAGVAVGARGGAAGVQAATMPPARPVRPSARNLRRSRAPENAAYN